MILLFSVFVLIYFHRVFNHVLPIAYHGVGNEAP